MQKGIFGLEKLTEEDIEAILATADIFARANPPKRGEAMKKRNIVPKSRLIAPREMSLEDLMDYLEFEVEYGWET